MNQPSIAPEEATRARLDLPKDCNEGVAYIDGAYVPIAEARIPILDCGFLRSDATYDVVHVWKGAFFRLDDHLDRFFNGIERLRLTPPLHRDAVRATLHECVRRSGLREAYVEMICTRGLLPSGSRDPRQAANRFYAFAIPFVWIADPIQQESGLHLRISSVERIAPAAVDPTVKNYHWLDFIRGLYEAYDRGGDTTVLVDGNDNVVEGPGFNIFAVVDGGIVTPKVGMLEGITRRTVIEIAAVLNLRLEERALPATTLRRCEEAFATSTAGGVMPITRIDGHSIGDGMGPVTATIRAHYWALHERSHYTTPIDMRAVER